LYHGCIIFKSIKIHSHGAAYRQVVLFFLFQGPGGNLVLGIKKTDFLTPQQPKGAKRRQSTKCTLALGFKEPLFGVIFRKDTKKQKTASTVAETVFLLSFCT
jgi:hypothetical protein